MAKTKQSRYVIFAGPQKQGASDACDVALDGYATFLRSKAAGFYSVADTKEFAEVSRVALNGHTYNRPGSFTESELNGWSHRSLRCG